MNGRTNAAGGKGGGITPEMFGCSKIAFDDFAFSAQMDLNTRISHSLGTTPKYAFWVTTQKVSIARGLNYGMLCRVGSNYLGVARINYNDASSQT